MRGRSPMQALAASPTMVGAITTLIVIVAVFLAYNANQGLPFVPVYKVSVEVPNAARLVRNNEVRIGGSRVGVVEAIEAVRETDATAQGDSSTDAGGRPGVTDPSETVDPEVGARLLLKLDKDAEPLPVDSIFRVRYRSSFGLKFLEVTRGDSDEMAPEGFTFDGTDDIAPDGAPLLSIEQIDEDSPEAQNGVFIEQTEFDDIGNTFDQRTRNAARANLVGFGNAFAGRGSSLNLTIESLNPLFRNLKPVARALTRPETRLRRFFPALERTAAIVAPVAEQQAELFTNMAITFGAISRDPEALKASISEGVPTLQAGIELLPRQRAFLRDFTELSRLLRPGVRDLRATLPTLNNAIRIGTPVLADTPPINRLLGRVFRELERLVDQRSTKVTLERLTETFDLAKPLARHVAPVQTVCNYWNYWFTFLPEHLTERDNVGFTQRVTIIGAPSGDTTVIPPPPFPPVPITLPGEVKTPLAGYSGLQANGIAASEHGGPQNEGVFFPYELPTLHANAGQVTGQDGSDCQSGQTGYPLGQLRLPGQPKSNPAQAVGNIPGDRGPTTLFFNQDSTRELRDTRVGNRQP